MQLPEALMVFIFEITARIWFSVLCENCRLCLMFSLTELLVTILPGRDYQNEMRLAGFIACLESTVCLFVLTGCLTPGKSMISQCHRP